MFLIYLIVEYSYRLNPVRINMDCFLPKVEPTDNSNELNPRLKFLLINFIASNHLELRTGDWEKIKTSFPRWLEKTQHRAKDWNKIKTSCPSLLEKHKNQISSKLSNLLSLFVESLHF